jgi:hypothetical protein
MIRWCKIKKRTGNATLYGQDLGCETPDINVKVFVEEKMPKPNIPITLIKPKK